MATVFRIATEQAIKEIVEENSVSGRFGLIVTEENIAEISKKVVDLFEMTLELRSKTQELFNPATITTAAAKQKSQEKLQEEKHPFPKTRNASEIYSFQDSKKAYGGIENTPLMPSLDAKLPRKRFELSLEEKERFMRR
ncbi:MAG: hypothetical protein V4591_02320 [Bdellovibrionota bacterium]